MSERRRQFNPQSEKFEGYCIGNVSRYPFKKGAEYLRKAQVYLGWAIETIESRSGQDEKSRRTFAVCENCVR